MQRRVDKIVSVTSNGYGDTTSRKYWNLPSVAEWNVMEHIDDTSPFTGIASVIDPTIGALFGNRASVDFLNSGSTRIDMSNAHVFESADFPDLVTKLQSGYNGSGIPGAPMAVQMVTTVENTFFGIAAGHQIELTLMYMSQWPQWVATLPEETQTVMNASTYSWSQMQNQSVDGSMVSTTQWPGNHIVGGNHATNWTVNLLTQQFTAIVTENPEVFKSIFTSTDHKLTRALKVAFGLCAFIGILLFACLGGGIGAIVGRRKSSKCR